MPTFRYPTLLCRDVHGGYTALAIDGHGAAFRPSAADAKHDLRDYLYLQHKQRPWFSGTDVRETELRWFTITVRPEYRSNDRIYPCETSVNMRVACVVGTRESGQAMADLPLLGIRFDYTSASDLPDLVRRYVLQKLEGLPPDELNRYLAPEGVELVEIAVRVPKVEDKASIDETTPPTLKLVAEPIGDRAVRKSYARAWERDAELQSLVNKLYDERANVLLVGESGVGKTTLLVDAVKEVEKRLENEGGKRKYWLSSAGRIIAGMKYLGQWEERVETLIEELGGLQGVLCVERLLGLVQRGGFGPTDSIAAFLMPYLARGELRMIAEATPTELDACRRLLPAFPDLFQIVPVQEFDRETALKVIHKQLTTTASGHSITIERGTAQRIVRLYRRFMPYASFPGPASAFSRDLVTTQARHGMKTADPENVITRFQRQTGLPELFLRDELTLDRDEVLTWFRERVIDQELACEAASDIVMTFKAGLNDPQRPPAVMLFCGPTGVGKTHLAQALANYFFGSGEITNQPKDKDRLIRLDMSEYSGFDAVARLLGPPHGEPSELIQRIRRQPFCVLLLDEIEKAAPDVFDTLMGVFDEGRLTDPFGRVTNFRSTIIIMTSNLGAGSGSAVGFGRESEGPRYREAAMKFFRPEFFNRMDAVVTFEPLKPAAVRAITQRELNAIAERDGLKRNGVKLIWSDALIEHLANVGFDAKYGARPLQRAIERNVIAPLATWLLQQEQPIQRPIVGEWVNASVVFSFAAVN